MDMNQHLHTILLIDDSYSKFIERFASVGKTHGFKIQPFDNVKAGIAFLQENENQIGAVLLDLSFTPNNYEGLEALKKIKNINTLLPVIMLTESQSKKEFSKAVECMSAGAFNYVSNTNYDATTIFQMLKVAVRQYQFNTETERYTSLKEEHRNCIANYEKMMQTTEMILTNNFKGKLMFQPTFEGRPKEFKSFYEKIKAKEQKEGFIENPFKRFSDLAGLRVVFYNAADMLKAIEILQSANDFVDMKTGKELVADDKGKVHGYRAVHFDVVLNENKRLHLEEYQSLKDIPCELQFKTIFAHSWSKVYHALSYKESEGMNLTEAEQEQLGEDFKTAAKNLERIEKDITTLCEKYHPNRKVTPNAN